MGIEDIIQELPYSKPFLFVDKILEIDDDHIKGSYTFLKDEYFYEGHFKDNPITPGVILTECMAQIGMACFGIYLLKGEWSKANFGVAMTSSDINFYHPVYPEEKVTVIAAKEYFRFNKLKCKVTMYNAEDVLVAKGIVAGVAFKK
ncbi:3-hydroxyacyl-[acyl-carrier-protein] dehydratase [Aquimarina sp. EL_43]|uniref:3-hydroxyacyl-ACP dehydratase FabZ family protein n=1 Tax=unclassified Aquimarina TaxID=2627091 RepID=UPI0018CA8B68|nr:MULTISPECIES: 3-hydroxyacyl-ACP dehydratase FabZ family protein [unclassified Aquimarina]MBG6129542.1 3-hydroxyacyl-[acyl-carrier-protein] dehydratase [Aquimarina sp. EL_35]MBG6150607.1 3-hydroxyacyl-[acyl-carrier-protein] dehydratase [Aquimarina sp. EL_32]MBG6168085.1 3-hydroxyacyl-[acyl-carrier-protein] dehydratase [Aquimarina sp. EL_43]